MEKASGGSEGDDEDSLIGGVDATGHGEQEQEEHVPFVLGSVSPLCLSPWKRGDGDRSSVRVPF